MTTHWITESHQALSAPVRSALLDRYGYVAPASDTYGALVSIIEESSAGTRCLLTFPFTFVLADYSGAAGTLEGVIDAECRARLLALRNADSLASIVGRKHPL